MKSVLTLFSAAILYGSISFAQQIPPTNWMKCYGGSGTDQARGMCNTSDNGVVVIGNAKSQNGDITSYKGGYDCWVTRLNPDGSIKWQKNIGGSADDIGRSVTNAMDGGFIVALQTQLNDGECQPNKGSDDFGIVKLDSNGTIVWAQSLGGSNYDHPMKCAPTADGGCIVIGYSTSSNQDVPSNMGNEDIWVVKLNGSGNIQWSRNYGGSGSEQGNYIRQTSDGGYIFCGLTFSNAASFSQTDSNVTGNHGGSDAWVVKLNSTGNIIWQKTYGGTAAETARWVEPTSDGGYIVGAQAQSTDGDVTGNHGNFDAWVLKINATGSIIWQKNYGGSAHEAAMVVKPMTAGGYIMAAEAASNDGDVTDHKGGTNNSDFWIVRLDSVGGITWKKSYGGIQGDGPLDILPTSDYGYYISGITYSNDGDVSGNHGSADYWVVRLGVDSSAVAIVIPNAVQTITNANIKVWPTLTNSSVHIQLPVGYEQADIQVIDIMGRSVAIENSKDLNRTIDMTDLPTGNYIIQVSYKDGRSVFRISRY